MAARKKKLPSKPVEGWYRAAIGKVRKPGGLLYSYKFYLSKDKTEYIIKRQALQARWRALVAQGHSYWPVSEIEAMVKEGLIRPSRLIKPDEAKDLIMGSQKEPLSDTDLAPFLGDDGRPKPEYAVPLIDIMARRIVNQKDVRIALFEQLYRDGLQDPKSLIEWCCRNLGWTQKDASTFLNFNINGASANPIAFNAFAPTDPLPTTPPTDGGADA